MRKAGRARLPRCRVSIRRGRALQTRPTRTARSSPCTVEMLHFAYYSAKAPRLVSASVGESCRRAPPPRVCCLLLTGWCVVVARERSSLSRLQSIWPAYTSRSVRHEVRRRGQRRSDRGRRRPPLTPAADIRSRSKNVLACGRTARRRRIPCPNSRRKSSSSREKHSGALFGAVMELDRSRARMNATTQDHPR
jgi:hypothetical protein